MNRIDKLRLLRELRDSGLRALVGDYIHDGVLYGPKPIAFEADTMYAFGNIEYLNTIGLRNVLRSVVELDTHRKCFLLFAPNTWLINYIDPDLRAVKDEETGIELPIEKILASGNFMPAPQIAL